MSSGTISQKEVYPVDKLLTILTLGIIQFFIVPQGYCRVITQWGRFVRIVKPGMGYCWSLWGLFQKPAALVPIMEQIRDYSEEMVYTKDGVEVIIDTAIYFTIFDPFKALFEVQNYDQAIQASIQSILRNECGKLTTRELFSGRSGLTTTLQEQLTEVASPWGITVRLVEIKRLEVQQKK